VAADLIGLLTPVEPEHMATIVEPQKIAMLLRASDGYRGDRITQLALKLAPLLFPRPIEFRTMEWEHITLDGPTPEWRVPWRRMKMRDPHIVPLSRQAVQILLDLKRLTGEGRYVFPHPRTDQRPRSENWITAALRSMGFSGEEMSWHGYRALASTQLNELGWNDKWIETQLAHAERNKVKGAYTHAKYLQQRRAMMQAWGDFLDELRAYKDGAAIDRAGTKAEAAARDT
jgi:integrase